MIIVTDLSTEWGMVTSNKWGEIMQGKTPNENGIENGHDYDYDYDYDYTMGTDEALDKGQSRRRFLQSMGGLAGTASLFNWFDSGSSGSPDENVEKRDIVLSADAGGTVTMIDAETFDVVKTINAYPQSNKKDSLADSIQSVGTDILNQIARENYMEHANISPDGKTVYVSRGHVGDVVAIDIETNELLWENNLAGFRADHQTVSEDGRFVYASDLVYNRVVKIHADTGLTVGSARARTWPHGLHIHEFDAFGGDKVLVNGSLGTVATDTTRLKTRLTFIDPQWMTVLRTVDFENGVRPMTVSEDGKIYLQISLMHGFHEYDVEKDKVTRTKKLPKTEHVPENESDYPLKSAHHGIALSPDGKYIISAGTTSWYVSIVRRSDFELVDTVEVGKYPYWVKVVPGTNLAFVPVRAENEVSIIDYEQGEEVGRAPTGKDPHVTEYRQVPETVL
ncbi:MAG: PQQ-binding-like beta-propeller repeat protein [Halobacteria archaeon]|nr:PQQ-binding-like beta-propeller repeat protein [Halobacteria archaeon]